MSQVKEEKPTAHEERKSGRAVFDNNRTVWEWQTATGVFERYVSEEQLSRLEASNLRLVEQATQDTGCAIYGAEPEGRSHRAISPRQRKKVSAVTVGAFRQFLRRLVPSA